jgi:hypothetical protein
MYAGGMRTAVYVRLQDPRHAMLSAYAKKHDFTINDVVERLVDQLLFQVEPRFSPPEWLVEAINEGYLPFTMPAQVVEDMKGADLEEGMAPKTRALRAL